MNHRWKREGGCKENPGVWSRGALMVYRETCERCCITRSKVISIIARPSRMDLSECHDWQDEHGQKIKPCKGV